jgi:predicted dehydrogenase
MSGDYRVAFIGCGRRALQHVPGVKADGRLRVTAVADVKREAADALNAAGGFKAAVYADHRELLAREKPDVVIACLWTPLHLPVFRDCVEAGARAVLSEKPMAPSWAESREMARLADAAKCQLTFCHQRRFAPGNRAVRRWIEEGLFGDVRRMDLYSPRNLLDCGTHTVDQALSFNRETPARWVLGALDLGGTKNIFNVPSESMAAATIVFQNGVRAHLQVGGPDMDLWGGVRVAGTKGHVQVLWGGHDIAGAVYADPSWRPPPVGADPHDDRTMIEAVRDAIDSLETGREPELSCAKALRAAEILFAIMESSRRRARVELPLAVEDVSLAAVLAERAPAPGAA